MVLVVNFSVILKFTFFCFFVAICDLDTMGRLYMAFVSCLQHLEIFSEIEVIPVKLQFAVPMKLQFHGHLSYFRKDFQMLLAVKEGEI